MSPPLVAIQVYYNNLLSVPPLGLLSIITLEPWRLGGYPHWGNLEFQVWARIGLQACPYQ